MTQETINHFWDLAKAGMADRFEDGVYSFAFDHAGQEAWPEIFGNVKETGAYYDLPELAFWMERGTVVCEW